MMLLHDLIEIMVTPPAISILFIVLGLIQLRRRKWFGRASMAFGLLSLYLLSTPFFMTPIYHYWATQYPIPDLEFEEAQAIVVLGGGRRSAREFGRESVNSFSLERVRYGAWLHKKTGLPVLLTGGRVNTRRASQAELMERALNEFGVEARWLEGKSRTTYQNALFSAPILEAEGIERVYLVTHGLHMPRSVWAFSQAGINVIPAPTVIKYRATGPLKKFLPDAATLYETRKLLHEWLGMLWYRVSKPSNR